MEVQKWREFTGPLLYSEHSLMLLLERTTGRLKCQVSTQKKELILLQPPDSLFCPHLARGLYGKTCLETLAWTLQFCKHLPQTSRWRCCASEPMFCSKISWNILLCFQFLCFFFFSLGTLTINTNISWTTKLIVTSGTNLFSSEKECSSDQRELRQTFKGKAE